MKHHQEPPSPGSRGRVLVVDDSPTLLIHTQQVLEEAGYEVQATSEYYIANLVSKFKPDLILMDVNLGFSYKGPSAVQALKNRSFTANSLFILHSTLDEAELRELAIDCGADGWLHKTQDPDELRRKVAEFLASRVALFHSTSR